MTRIQVIVDEREREVFRAQAEAEGMSLSAWVREAARERIRRQRPERMRTSADLQRFFAACDAREQGREPDWDEHLEVITSSRVDGLPAP